MPQAGLSGPDSIQRPAMSTFGVGVRTASGAASASPAQPVSIVVITKLLTIGTSVNPDVCPYFMVGITNSAPDLMPDGQREVTVLVLV